MISILNSNDEIPVILAPMAGITDLAFREICTEHGCSFSYSEMVSAKAISYNNKKTFRLMDYSDKAKPFGIQIFGHEPVVIGEIAKQISEQYFGIINLIDINMGCPAPKIVNNGDGCALMKDMLLASKIIEYAVKNSALPVTVKFRLGWDENNINALQFAKMAEESGAGAVTVHGRTRSQMYSGKANRDMIAHIKQCLKIPVIGNGDITNAASASKMLQETSCDGIMIGRAAQGNPFIFNEIKAALNQNVYTPPTISERVSVAIEHMNRHEKYKGKAAFPEMRKHIAWYIKGIKGSSAIREKIFRLNNTDEAYKLLNELMHNI